ncbi:sensor histidine kinase [Pedobacter hartonius]|uniref:histidine kinase n=1 Tax=Pedobacter hartonius TaxID=425514 RepID=A0A1H4H2F9_9SPHI|nr:sensor histidine kinase [Pedobacter hartonius]SEB15192.1 Signal transduction histidine kinase [Pedobacter hartonius]
MRSLTILLLFLVTGTAKGEVIVIGKDLPYTSLGRSVTYLKDNGGRLTLGQVIKADQQHKFLKSNADVLNFGNTAAAYWVKCSYINRSRDNAFLILDISSIEEIDFYAQDSPGKYSRIHSGSTAALNPKVITANNYIFSLPISAYPGKTETIYLRLRTNNILFAPLKIALSQRLIAGINAIDSLEAISIGILLALLLFNMSVYVKSRDLTYLYYSIRILGLFIFLIFYFRGYSYLLNENFRHYINTHPHIFLGIGSMAGIAFSNRFLNLKAVLPCSVKLVRVLSVAWLTLIVISMLGYKAVGSDISQFLSAFTALTLLGLGITAYVNGYKLALYYIFAWSFVCLTTVWTVLSLAGFFPYNESSFHLMPLGFIFELLLLSLALGDRLREMKKSKLQGQADQLKVQEENLYLIGSQNERLEKIVESRTRALKKLVQSLEQANADKTRIFSIIAHDLRSPFNSLISLFSLNDMNLLTFEDVKKLLNDSRKNVDNIHNTLNNLLYWAQSQMKGIITSPSRFNMRVMVEDLMLVYQPLIRKKNIKTEVVVDDDADVFADLNQINLVMRNLIDNAIKFTPLGYHIHIRIWGNSNFIYVDVCNPISDTINIDRLIHKERNESSYGTSNERGIGLGLHLCRDFVEKNGGMLKVSKKNECIILRFNILKFISEASSAIEASLMEEA